MNTEPNRNSLVAEHTVAGGIPVIFGNPFGLPICSDLPASMTKGELVKRVLPGDWTFDYALPQGWLDHFHGELYFRMVCRCVTVYPPDSDYQYFGAVLDLLTGTVYPL